MSVRQLIFTVACLLFLASCIDPPVLHESFQEAFDETYIQNGSTYKVNGQWYYDAKNNRERTDRVNGRYNLFCGTVLPNVTAACTQLTVNNKRYIIYPQRKSCCFCCDSQHGCGILKRNWLDGAKFLGVEKLIDTNYNKWSKDGDISYNYYWSTIDANQIPRKLDEGGSHITDYLTHTYINKTFDDSYFALPSYCNETACAATSFCGKLRGEQNQLKFE